jgi:hypothetical protein
MSITSGVRRAAAALAAACALSGACARHEATKPLPAAGQHAAGGVVLAAVSPATAHVTAAPVTSAAVVASFSAPTPPSVNTRGGAVPSLLVPRAKHAVVPSEEFDVGVWGDAVNTHTLLDAQGRGAVPVSEARFLWGQGNLYLNFYAGDLDLQIHSRKHDGPIWKDDAVVFFFPQGDGSEKLIVASAVGVVADALCSTHVETPDDPHCALGWESHARAAADYDGTINQIGDRDEEWNVELAVPLRSLGIERPEAGMHVPFRLRRCEIAYDGPHQCGQWGTAEQPAELVFQ